MSSGILDSTEEVLALSFSQTMVQVVDFCGEIQIAQTLTIISGTVHDPSGRPVAQARVYFMSGPVALPDIAMLTDEEGVFALSAPSEGTYQIGIAASNFAPTSVMVTVKGGQEVKLKLMLDKDTRQ